MADQPSEATVEARLREFVAAEVRQAELDFPLLQLPERRTVSRGHSVGLLAAAVGILVFAVVGFRLLEGISIGTGGTPVRTDRLPTSINGEPVVSGDAIATHSAGDTFLAGGRLVLAASPEDWRLEAEPIGDPSGVYVLDNVAAAPRFVRTSGALTVARVHAQEGRVLTVDEIVWRQPTKGPVPADATPAQGRETNDALWPDFVSVWGQDGVTIAGYVPKSYLLEGGDLGPGDPSNPPQPKPEPVYGEDLTTLVGQMVPGVGFVALGSPAGSAIPSVLAASASVAPSAAPSATPSAAGSSAPGAQPPAIADCGRISDPAVCAKTIALARRGHEAELMGATRVVVDDTCEPFPVICDRHYPFDAVVVFVTAGADTTGWYRFHVFGLGNVPTTAEEWLGEVPAHVLQRLQEPQPTP